MEEKKGELFLRLEKMRSEVIFHREDVMEKHRNEVFRYVQLFLNLQKIAVSEGLAALEEESLRLFNNDNFFDSMALYGIQTMIEEFHFDSVMAKMLKQFPAEQEDYDTKFMLYLNIRFVSMLQQGISNRTMQDTFLSFFSKEERKRLEEYLSYGFYAVDGGE